MVLLILALLLSEAVKHALENNTSLMSFRMNVLSSEYEARSFGLTLLPSVSASASLTRQFKLQTVRIPTPLGEQEIEVGSPTVYGFSFSALLPLSPRNFFLYLSRRWQAKAERERLEDMKNAIALAVVQSYVSVALAKELVKTSRFRLKKAEADFEFAKALFEQGLLTETELMRFSVALDRAKLSLSEALTQLENSVSELSYLSGIRISPDDVLSIDRIWEEVRDGIDSAHEPGSYAPPSVRALLFLEKSADWAVKSSYYSLLPSVSVGFSLIYSFGGFVESRGIPLFTVQANLLVLDWGARILSARASLYMKRAFELSAQDEKRKIELRTKRMISEMKLLREKVEVARREVEFLQKLVEDTQSRFSVGKATAKELVEAREKLYVASFNVENLKARFILNFFKLMRETGLDIQSFLEEKNL